ncbi:histidine ammonia-lyase [Kordiimonas sp. SCSIO 12610]|uniref:histidine ammonia-lyase n=1 Tax=Kordiimonas sp. SCSIO 12610 TaxID=2829597 RepID=UPI002109E0B0|nr:histidine ammonia-lyase [Kordiimonas sp. SCSIO 12610]UTW54721.1 histidine ammonia-lyase [Kordiimonas sp. SCSIO 12610]
MLTLIPGEVSLKQLKAILSGNLPVKLDESARQRIRASAKLVAEVAVGDNAVYGINTGFGKLASIRIPADDTATLQRNLILSHCCGVGVKTPDNIVRLMMALKLISLGRGASGVREVIIDLLGAMLAKGVIPIVPAQGSVGASGDLAPLAHMAAVMIGEGHATYQNEVMTGADALHRACLKPVVLGPKEGLALINGTQFSTAYALAGLFEAHHAANIALLASALSIDAAKASTAPLAAEIHNLRGHPGQIAAASVIRDLLEGSEIRESHRADDPRVQDPYCIRCQPQVVGAAIDLLNSAAKTLVREANAATDNPLVLTSDNKIVSGGNFHAEPVAFAADIIALAVSEIGAIAQRRIALLVDPTLSFDLPPFLASDPGLNSGLMIAEVTSAALMSENKHLANPCSTDSTPTSANQEDHVSMAAHGARRLMPMTENLFHILGIEVFCAAEGIRYREPEQTSVPLRAILHHFYNNISPLYEDRFLAPSLEEATKLVRDMSFINQTNVFFPELEDI